MRKYTIHISYSTADESESVVDDLQRRFIKQFEEAFPDAKLQSVFVAKEDFEPKPKPDPKP